ncbi:MAG: NADH-quinone oxidoreductase subunit G [Deltaproteobacteria bacterium GWA2_54_12]|nr:MAG: NADH-quinone oxidoreductase subunit G [Deltaproteobacteria bacterium GWA2_54_12]
MAKILIENREYEVEDGQNLLQACLSHGFNIPYFCWHPAMHSAGACRQCAVKVFKDENDTRGRIVMSCVMPVAKGMRVSIDDPEAKAFRENVIEWLMSNHPHDCPVCDEGGECHLQDMTQMTGHVYRRFRFKKRTYKNQYLGPLVNHEMNRCIQCYRCVRFYRGYAGGRDLDAFASRNRVYFGRSEDGVLESPFSGNLVEVCPTGVFTDKTLKSHFARKWDLQTAPSVCVHCGVGCNIIPGERYGELRRVSNRYNGEVNGYFLCDRGRFGYEFVNSPQRVKEALLKTADGVQEVSKEEALRLASHMIGMGGKVMAVGSPRATVETNFALRTLAGAENFYSGFSRHEARLASLIVEVMEKGPARSPSLKEVRSADAVLVLGEDVTNTAPILALALRQAAKNGPLKTAMKLGIPFWDDMAIKTATQGKKGPFYAAAPYATDDDDAAVKTFHGPPVEIARFAAAIARELNPSLPIVDGHSEETASLAREVAQALLEAERPLVVSGTGSGSEAVIQAAANVAWALCARGKKAGLTMVMPECDSLGAALIDSKGLDEAFAAAAEGEFDTLVIAENDIFRRMETEDAENFLASFSHVIVIDHVINDTVKAAHITLPGASFAESTGTLINFEGRAQKFFQVFVSAGAQQASWRWLKDMMDSTGLKLQKWESLDDVTSDAAAVIPAFEKITRAAPKHGFRIAGQKIPRQTHRRSGRTAVEADKTVYESKPTEDEDTPFSFSMEGFQGQPPSPLIARFWAPGWNSVQSVTKYQEYAGGPLRGGDPGLRLIEPKVAGAPFFKAVPISFKARKYGWLLVPMPRLFGSEELSVFSPPLASLQAKPFIGIAEEDAERLEVEEGDEIAVRANGKSFGLPAIFVPGLTRGVAAVPLLPGMAMLTLPAWGVLTRAKRRAA